VGGRGGRREAREYTNAARLIAFSREKRMRGSNFIRLGLYLFGGKTRYTANGGCELNGGENKKEGGGDP